MNILLLVLIIQVTIIIALLLLAEAHSRDHEKRIEEILKCQRNAQHEAIDLLYRIYREK